MEFQETKSIYLQIGDTLCDKILNNEFKAGDRMPSVREMAADVGVNPNTVMRTYSELESNGIIKNKRGVGFFVLDKAYDSILQMRKKAFIERLLPEFMQQVVLLNLNSEEITLIIDQLKKTVSNENK